MLKKYFILLLIITQFIFSGNEKINQLFKELNSKERVLIIAYQPGFVSTNTIKYFRNNLGAELKILYITNGESSINKTTDLTADEVAFELRRIADYESEKYNFKIEFLNYPDIQEKHIFDEIIKEVIIDIDNVISEFSPTKLVIERDFYYEKTRNNDLINLIKENKYNCEINYFDKNGIEIPNYYNYENNLYNEYSEIKNISNCIDLKLISVNARQDLKSKYDSKIKSLFQDLKNKEKALRGIHNLLIEINDDIKKTNDKNLVTKYLKIEELRCEILGIKTDVFLKDSNLINVQLTKLILKNIKGDVRKGELILFIPAVNKGWIVNQTKNMIHKIKFPSEIEIISQEGLPNTLLNWKENKSKYFKNGIDILIVNKAENEIYSFAKTINLRFHTTNKLFMKTAKKYLIQNIDKDFNVNYTNYSNDRLIDKIYIKGNNLRSDTIQLKLLKKDESKKINFKLIWLDAITNESNNANLYIGSEVVAELQIKKIQNTITKKSIGFITNKKYSFLKEFMSNYYNIESEDAANTIIIDGECEIKNIAENKTYIFINHENSRTNFRNIMNENNKIQIDSKNYEMKEWSNHLNNKSDLSLTKYDKIFKCENNNSEIILIKNINKTKKIHINLNLLHQFSKYEEVNYELLETLININ